MHKNTSVLSPVFYTSEQLVSFLNDNSIKFSLHFHDPVFTCEQAAKNIKHLPGISTKNLFLTNKTRDVFYVVTVSDEKKVNITGLQKLLGVTKLSFGTDSDLKDNLNLLPGSVTCLSAINDFKKSVTFIFDSEYWNDETYIQAHPLINTATVLINILSIKSFFHLIGKDFTVLPIPKKNDENSSALIKTF